MSSYLIRRGLQGAILMLIVSAVVFGIIRLAPGGPAFLMDPEISREDSLYLMEQMGLADPLPVQYWRWFTNVLRGDLGRSFERREAVAALIRSRAPNSMVLVGTALSLAVLVAIPIGIISAVRPYSWLDYAVTTGSFLGVSLPNFFLAIMLIVLFSVYLGWLPSAGMYTIGLPPSLVDRAKYLILPTVTLATSSMAQLMRYTRSSMQTVLGMDYVRTARAKGLRETTVLYRHALRNALMPVVTVIGMMIPRLVGGAAITESVFGWPGMGRLAVDAAFQRDYPLIMGITLMISLLVVMASLMVDLLYVFIDPRVKLK